MYALGIDLGTTFTAASTWRNGHAEIASLGSRAAAIPSVVLLRADETFLTGETANRRGLSEPHRVAREFKRRIGDTIPILLGGVPYSAEALMARLLRSVVDEVAGREGGRPASITISHPANWGPYKTDLLRQAVRIAGLTEPVTYTTEPEAAAIFYAQQQRMEPGTTIAVYDLGGGTFDAAVLRKTATGFEILGHPEGIERLGGIDFDAAVYAHVARAIGPKLAELDEDDPAAIAAVARLREECVQAKEALSEDTDVSIPVLLPNLATEIRLTRAELESMVRPALYDSIEALKRAVQSAGVSPDQLDSVLLVGGSSRMPIVAQLVGAELGRPVAVDAHPKHAVALGAAWLASTPIRPQLAPGPARGGAAVGSPVVGGSPVSPGVGTVPGGMPVSSPPVRAAGTASVADTSLMPGVAAGGTTDLPAELVAHHPQAPLPQGTYEMPGTQQMPGVYQPGAYQPDAYQPGAYQPDAYQPGGYPARASASVPPPAANYGGASGSPGKRRGILIAATAAVAVLAVSGISFAVWQNTNSSNTGNNTGLDGGPTKTVENSADPTTAPPTTAPTTPPATTAPAIPPDEQCTDAIKSNPRWICLTKATISGNKITVEYNADSGADPFKINGGFHLHIYGSDGTTPADKIMGLQANPHGTWYLEDQKPSVRALSSNDYRNAIGDNATKVCARIATSGHKLVPDGSGTYKTGNCVPITGR